jgi:hypothetical protein
MNRIRLLVQAIVMVGILTGCDSCGGDMVEPYIVIKGKTVLIHNTTGQDLEANGVMTKLRTAAATENVSLTDAIVNGAIANGVVIVIEDVATYYSSAKIRGNQMLFHIDYLTNTETSNNSVLTALYNGFTNVANGTDFGLAPVQKTPGGAGLSLNLTNTRSNSASPRRADYSPYGTDYNPYRVDYSPYGVGLSPCGADYSPCGVDLSLRGTDYSPCGVDLSPCGMDYRPLLRRAA